jgi:hypothetical protein
MPRPKKPLPSYRLHKQSGQAIVTVTVNGVRKDMTLGHYGTDESYEEYERIIKDIRERAKKADALKTTPNISTTVPAAPADITVNELCVRFLRHAEVYYSQTPEGKPSTELVSFKYAIKEFRAFAGEIPAREFGPVAFMALRERMIEKKWARPTINRQGGGSRESSSGQSRTNYCPPIGGTRSTRSMG